MASRIDHHPLGPGYWPITSAWRSAHRPGHRGVDIGVWKKPLYAAITGKARRKDQPGGAGYYVEIYAGNRMVSTFHMSRVDITDGQQVTAGQQIGISGGVPGEPGAGNTDGAHLHFEIWENGVDTNPAPDLATVGASTGGAEPPPEEKPEPPTEEEDDMPLQIAWTHEVDTAWLKSVGLPEVQSAFVVDGYRIRYLSGEDLAQYQAEGVKDIGVQSQPFFVARTLDGRLRPDGDLTS